MKPRTGCMPKKHYSNFYSSSDHALSVLTLKFKYTTLLLGIILMLSHSAYAIDDQACKIGNVSGIVYEAPPLFSPDKRANIDISANKTTSEKDGSSIFEGDVVIEKHELRIRADHAEYDNTNKQVSVTGNVHVDTPSMSVDADGGNFLVGTERSEFINIQFYIPETRLRGGAESVTSPGKNIAKMHDSYVTSCPPDDIDWLLQAKSIQLDMEDEYGKAKGVLLRFKQVPILYTPYIEFPIGDRRRSGLLIPTIGTSSSRGFELTVPYYWNIAPNQDAILAPHFMNRRGWQLDTNYRYLTRTTKGVLDFDYLHQDRITQETRYSINYDQQTIFNSNLRLAVDYKDVSDAEYLSDFSTNLNGASTTHLPRSASLDASYSNWLMRALIQTYETLDLSIAESDRPYRILPQLTVNGSEGITDTIDFFMQSELVNFVHEDDVSVEGPRFNLTPGLHFNFRDSGWFVKPELDYYFTAYNIEDGAGNSVPTDEISAPIASVDSGLFFDRNMGNGFLQTLEPRLFYLYIPYRDQSGLPIFDSSIPDFSYAQMFRKNRFNGGDRLGDANQVTLALSSRIIDSNTGLEYMRASIGQIYYFDDRRITESGPETANTSDVIGDVVANYGNWRGKAGIQWDVDLNQTEKGNASIHYENNKNYIVNLGYSKRRQTINNLEAIEQTDFSFVAPVSNDITLLGRWNYSLAQERELETIAGLSYDSCCWSMILALQRYLVNSSSIDEEYDNTILFQLVLKGLGSVSGDSATDRLKSSILGFKEQN